MEQNKRETLKKYILAFFLAVLMAAVFAQFYYAVRWAIGTAFSPTRYEEANTYVKNAQKLSCNGWQLLGYSLFLRLMTHFNPERILNKAALGFIFLFQLMSFLVVVMLEIKELIHIASGRKKPWIEAVFCGIAISTLPGIWHMIFSTLPDIWILAGEVVILSKGSKYLLLRWNDEDQLDQKKKRRIIIKDSILVTGSNFLVGILSKPDFWAIILLEILMVLIFALVPKRKKLQNSFWIWVFIPFIGIMGAFTFNHFTVKNSSYMALDVPNAFFLETVSPYLIADYPYYGNNLSDVISEEEIQIVGANREVIKNSFVPMVIARAGEKGYKIVRRDLVRTSLKLHFTEIVFRTGKEVFQYLFFPFSFIGNVLGKPNGRQVYNMTRMWKYSWVAAKEFLAAGSIAFGLIIPSALGIYFVKGVIGKEGLKIWKTSLAAGGGILIFVLPKIIAAEPGFDYRIGNIAAIIWMMGLIFILYQRKSKKNVPN